MQTAIAKVFTSGKSQTVQLPLEFGFNCKELYIEKQGDTVILRPKSDTLIQQWQAFFEMMEPFPDNFMQERNDMLPQERNWS